MSKPPDLANASSGSQAPVIEEIARLLARQKLVPFFGAGISRAHLGGAAAELAEEMCGRVGCPRETLLSDVADIFVDRLGCVAFIEFLRTKLVVRDLRDADVPSHRFLLSLSSNLLYTTNQDNLFELTAAHYGRPYRRVATLQDLSDAVPGERLLVKFHGDLDVPSSLVFGARSYQQRMAAEAHPLDIKLRADLLGKQLLFIGYSLKDENVTKLLASVRRAFAGEMPPSYLIAFDYDPEIEVAALQFGVRVIDPREHVPDAAGNAEAFERLLKVLCDRTISFQSAQGLDDLFSDRPVNRRIVTEFEVNAVAAVLSETFESAVAAFRGAFDQSVVPESLQRQVTDTFLSLIARADPTNYGQMDALADTLFHFRLPPTFALEAMGHLMAAANRRPAPNAGFDDRFVVLPCPAAPDGSRPAAAAFAVAKLWEREEPISDDFRRLAFWWFQGFEDLPPPLKEKVKSLIEIAWPGDKAANSPLKMPGLFKPLGFHAIVGQMMASMPKQFGPRGE